MRVMLVVVGLAACDKLYSASSSHPPPDASSTPTAHCSPITMLSGHFGTGATFHTHWWDGVATSPAVFQTTASSVTIASNGPGGGGSATITANAYLDLREATFTLTNLESAAFGSDMVVKVALVEPRGATG